MSVATVLAETAKGSDLPLQPWAIGLGAFLLLTRCAAGDADVRQGPLSPRRRAFCAYPRLRLSRAPSGAH